MSPEVKRESRLTTIGLYVNANWSLGLSHPGGYNDWLQGEPIRRNRYTLLCYKNDISGTFSGPHIV